MPEDSTAAGEEDDMAYAISSTYTPALTPLDVGVWDIVDISLDPGTLGFSRVGSGAGVPSAGDTVTLFGAVTVTDPSTTDGVTIPLPFVASEATFYHVRIDTYGTDWSAFGTVENGAETVLRLVIDDGVDPAAVFKFLVIYQTENAVDP